MKKVVFALCGVVVVAALIWLIVADSDESVSEAEAPSAAASVAERATPPKAPPKTEETPSAAASADETEAEAEEPGDAPEAKTPEELKEEAEEAAVEAFDGLTDKWMEPSEKGVTMADVDAFVREFKKVPAERKEECLQRALNLVPDENVMLLAGVLMDKSQPKELVELVFNDVLNRDEDVKKPILQQVYKDKTHPCWADTAWILDVTGEAASKEK